MRKGIILAGGKGTRLSPVTNVINKHLLPVFNKPMIYYPLSTLMLSGIRDILIITNKESLTLFKSLFGNGKHLGINLSYKIQEEPRGLADAFLIADDFLRGYPSAMILGDNLFHGTDFQHNLNLNKNLTNGASIFVYPVLDPERYGVAEFNNNNKVISIEEKPKNPKSRYAITGLYFYDKTVVEKAKKVRPSKRGEIEITDINLMYLKENNLRVNVLGRGTTWFDTGTPESLLDAGQYVNTIEKRQGYKISVPEEIAWRNGWINNDELENLAKSFVKIDYGKYLMQLINENGFF